MLNPLALCMDQLVDWHAMAASRQRRKKHNYNIMSFPLAVATLSRVGSTHPILEGGGWGGSSYLSLFFIYLL